MDVLDLPLEFLVLGVPLSAGASADSRELWKARVAGAAKLALPADYFCTTATVAVTIYYFSPEASVGDIDNIVKPILDALNGVVYVDDSQVDRVLVQRFPSSRPISIENPSPTLIDAIEQTPPIVFVRIHDDLTPLEP